jgi:hypothetical protein
LGTALLATPLWIDACALDLSSPNPRLGHTIKGCYTALDDLFHTETPIMRPFEYLAAFALLCTAAALAGRQPGPQGIHHRRGRSHQQVADR